MSSIRISVIMWARNAGSFLRESLKALRAEYSGQMEIIVVDDASADDTADVAGSMGARVFSLQRYSGPSVARNMAASKAKGEYLLFLDAHASIKAGTISRVMEYLDQTPDAAAVFGSYDALSGPGGTITQYRNLSRLHEHLNASQEARTFWAGCGAIRREIFLDLGGFDGITYPRCQEDRELGYRLRQSGHSIHRDKELFCVPLERWSLYGHMRSELLCRVIPWTRLDLESEEPTFDLLLKRRRKLSIVLALLFLVFLPLAFIGPGFLFVAVTALFLFISLEGRLFYFFLRRRGPWFTLKSIPLRVLECLCSGAGCLYAWLGTRLNLRVRDGNS